MDRELWSELSQAIGLVDARWKDKRVRHPTSRIVRVYLWSALHDRPISWGCDADNWDHRTRPPELPDQSTMSRRTRGRRHGKCFEAFLTAVGQKLCGPAQQQLLVSLRRMDGKPLPVASHSTDRDARWGRGAGQQNRGYKLHAIRSEKPMPEQWAVTSLAVDERTIARRMIKRLDPASAGYLLADGLYDSSELHDRAAPVNQRLIAPRRKVGTGRGHRYQSPRRLRTIDMLESPANVNPFGAQLYRQRPQIERDFGNLVSFGGGLTTLPAWVRRIWRVRSWVHAKLLINAARIRIGQRKRAVGA
jgi:hypothetical protein